MRRETHYARSVEAAVADRVVGDGPIDVVCHPGVVSHVELMAEMPTRGISPFRSPCSSLFSPPLIEVVNSLRMLRLPDLEPSANVEGAAFG